MLQELRTHKKGIPEHYDFVYVCTIDEAVDIDGELNPDWYSLSELKRMEQDSRFGTIFPDVLPTLESIIYELEKEDYFLNK